MAIATTVTTSKTYPRVDLLALQIERMLRRSLLESSTIAKIMQVVREGAIEEVSIYALDGAEICYAELLVKIDWTRHAVHIRAGRDTVSVNASWRSGVSVEMDLVVDEFERYVELSGLRRRVGLRYASHVDRDAMNQRLGFVRGRKYTWADGAAGTRMSIPELDEFTISLKMSPWQG